MVSFSAEKSFPCTSNVAESGRAAEGDAVSPLEVVEGRHGSVGHGGDHLLPAFISPSLILPVLDGGIALGTWQTIVLSDPNRGQKTRQVRLNLLPASREMWPRETAATTSFCQQTSAS